MEPPAPPSEREDQSRNNESQATEPAISWHGPMSDENKSRDISCQCESPESSHQSPTGPIRYYNTPRRTHYLLKRSHLPLRYTDIVKELLYLDDIDDLQPSKDRGSRSFEGSPSYTPRRKRKYSGDSISPRPSDDSPTRTRPSKHPKRSSSRLPTKSPSRQYSHPTTNVASQTQQNLDTPTTSNPSVEELSENVATINTSLQSLRGDYAKQSKALLSVLEDDIQDRARARERTCEELRNIGHQLSLIVDLEMRKGTASNDAIVPGTPNED